MTFGRQNNQTMRPPLTVRIRLWLSVGKRVDGIWVGSYFQTNDSLTLYRVEQALHLIKEFDRSRYTQVVRDLDRVWVRLLPSELAHFDYTLRACVLDERFVLAETTEPNLIAAVIVHEATHARLWRCGIGYDEALRARVEAICVRRELAFASRLADGEHVRELAQRALDSPSGLLDTDLKRRELKGFTRLLRHLGVPSCLVRLVLAIRLRRGARATSITVKKAVAD
jgi:hypothetical protein